MTATCFGCALAAPDPMLDPLTMTSWHADCLRQEAKGKTVRESHKKPGPPLIDVLAPAVQHAPSLDTHPSRIAMAATYEFAHFKGGLYHVMGLAPDAGILADHKPAWARFIVAYKRSGDDILYTRPLDEFLGRAGTQDKRRFWPTAYPVLKAPLYHDPDFAIWWSNVATNPMQCGACQLVFPPPIIPPSGPVPCPHCAQACASPYQGEIPMFTNDLSKGMNDTLGDDRLEKAIATHASENGDAIAADDKDDKEDKDEAPAASAE